MRNFSWQYFAKTGDVDAYLLYKVANEQQHEPDLLSEEIANVEAGREQVPLNEDLYSK